MFEGKVECPRCHRVWILPQASPGTYCDCHLYCEDGSKPSDCNMTTQNYSGSLGWPHGADQKSDDKREKRWHAWAYCSVHERYSYKAPIWLEVNWTEWYAQGKKLPRKMRELQQR